MAESPLQVSPKANQKPKAKGSPVWQFFHYVNSPPTGGPANAVYHVICNMCNRTLSIQYQSTSSMWKHLRGLHPEAFAKASKEAEERKDSAFAISAIRRRNRFPCGSRYRNERLSRVVCLYLAKNLQPLSTVDDYSFRGMLKEFDSNYQHVSPEGMLTSHLPIIHDLVRTKVVVPLLTQLRFVALSAEVWFNYTGAQFWSISAKFFDPDWKARKVMLNCHPWDILIGKNQVPKLIEDCLDSWGIPIEKLSATTGNVETRVGSEDTASWVNVPCFRHALDSIVAAGLEEEKVRALKISCMGLPEFSGSSGGLSQGRSECEVICDMFSQVLDQKPSDQDDLSPVPSSKANFSKGDLRVMEDLLEIVSPLRDLAESVGDEQWTDSAASILPSLALVKSVLSLKEGDGHSIAVVKYLMSTKMQQRFGSQELMDLLAKACFLDPRFKSLPFVSTQEKVKLREDIVREAELMPSNMAPEEYPEQPLRKKKKRPLADLFQDIIPQADAPSTSSYEKCSIDQEIVRYLAETDLPLSSNPLEWWARNALQFPTLQLLGRKYLCIPASVLPYNGSPEKLSRRASLPASDVRHMLFLHDNMPDGFLDSIVMTGSSRGSGLAEQSDKKDREESADK